MAQDKKSFILYSDLIETISKVPDDVAGKVFKMILEYVNDQNPETSDLLLQVLFEPIKQQLKRDLVKYEGKKGQFSDAGKESAKARRLIAPQLYVLHFFNEFENFLKVGVTDHSLNKRYSSLSKWGYKFEIVCQYFPVAQSIKPLQLEEKVMQKFKQNRYKPIAEFPGYMECFDLTALNEIVQFVSSFNVVQSRSTPPTVNVSANVNVNVNESDKLKLHAQLFNDSLIWQESICMKHFKGTKKEEAIKLLPDFFARFFLHVSTQSKENQSINEHKSFFDNWLRVELSKNPIKKGNIQPKSEKYK